MAQLQIPLSIWLSATPDERDGFYVAAGFDPNLPVIDNGTDTNFVRFRQDEPAVALPPVSVAPVAIPDAIMQGPTSLPSPITPQAGDDLRDFQTVSITTDEFGIAPSGDAIAGALVLSVSALAVRLPGPLRTQFFQWLRASGAGVGSRLGWGLLPSWLRSALALVGISGATIVVDTLIEGGSNVPAIPTLPGAISPLQQVQVVGSWVANGVTFYRLADGKLAVQNKKGRWKVWKPKKPIVLYADGASSLKTMLRADKALTKQAKKISSMLNRRAPRRKSSASATPSPIILGNNARVVDV